MAHSLASTALLVRINNDFDVFRHIEVIRILRQDDTNNYFRKLFQGQKVTNMDPNANNSKKLTLTWTTWNKYFDNNLIVNNLAMDTMLALVESQVFTGLVQDIDLYIDKIDEFIMHITSSTMKVSKFLIVECHTGQYTSH